MTAYGVPCPNCNTDNDVHSSDLNYNWEAEIKCSGCQKEFMVEAFVDFYVKKLDDE
jgi:predicted Zn finger-like uncharacterized protein